MSNGAIQKFSEGVALCDIKGRNLFWNDETQNVVLLWTLAMNHGQLVLPFSGWLTRLSVTRSSETSLAK